jgi:hypothetical protein
VPLKTHPLTLLGLAPDCKWFFGSFEVQFLGADVEECLSEESFLRPSRHS